MKGDRIVFKPQGLIGRSFDWLMVPIMYLLQGNFKELPQRTHFWNNTKLTEDDIRHLDMKKMVSVGGCEGAVSVEHRTLGFIPTFHAPILGGWNDYVVISLADENLVKNIWYIGWINEDGSGGISLVPVEKKNIPFYSDHPYCGPVRMLVGPKPVKFFGLDSEGCQIEILYCYEEKIGNDDSLAGLIPLH